MLDLPQTTTLWSTGLFLGLSWAGVELGWYLMHRLMHLTHFEEHQEHHRLFTPRDFSDVGYRKPSTQASWRQTLLFAIPTLIQSLVVGGLYGPVLGLVTAIGAAVYSRLIVYIHEAYHIRGHWLTRFAWFHRRRMLHWSHHVQDDTNYGFVGLPWDWILGTYRDPAERFLPMVERLVDDPLTASREFEG